MRKRRSSSSKLENNASDDENERFQVQTPGAGRFLESVSKDKSKLAAANLNSSRGNVGIADETSGHWVRRSTREVGQGDLDNPHVIELITNLRLQDESMEVLKLKKWLGPDANTLVMDAVLDALQDNFVVQALYVSRERSKRAVQRAVIAEKNPT